MQNEMQNAKQDIFIAVDIFSAGWYDIADIPNFDNQNLKTVV